MSALLAINKYFWRYRYRLLTGAFFVIASNFFRVLQPQVVRQALDVVFENLRFYSLFNGFDNQQWLVDVLGRTLFFFGLLVIGLALLMGFFMYWMRQTVIYMSRLIERDLRNDIFVHYEKMTPAFYKRRSTGDLMSRIAEDVSKVRMYAGPVVMYSINLLFLFVFVIGSMLKVSPRLTLYSLLPLPVLSVSIYYVSSIINRRSERIQQQLARLNSIAQEVYSGIRVVKAYVRERFFVRFFARQSEEYKKDAMQLVRVDAFFRPLMILLIGLSIIITVYAGAREVIAGRISPGNVAEFVLYVSMLTWPVTAIGWIASMIQQAAASQKRINEMLDIRPDIATEVEDPYPLRGDIAFKNVTFQYPDTGIVALKNVSFELKAGQRMAIVGQTGSGKSSLAELLERMYDVTSGAIEVDGRDLRKHDLYNLRRNIGYVPQDVFLFSDTVANNIRFGKPDASMEEIEAYARRAAVYEDIQHLPKGFETQVGERGVALSGGQKQRISLARALIKKPRILLLDDALSAVDSETEKTILQHLSTEMAGKTVIIITHRIFSLLSFDKIIVLSQGEIVEEGTHESLLKKGGYYADMYKQQLHRPGQTKSLVKD